MINIVKQQVVIPADEMCGNNHLVYEADLVDKLNAIGRVCYNSPMPEDISKRYDFVRGLIAKGHESVIEHCSLTVQFITDRGVSHELVRHRLASFTQVSQRYVSYKKNLDVILPIDLMPDSYSDDLNNLTEQDYDNITDYQAYILFKNTVQNSYTAYLNLLDKGYPPQTARDVLPNATATEIFVTANFREWRHILKLRTSKAAHPKMRTLMNMLLKELDLRVPVIFGDIKGG